MILKVKSVGLSESFLRSAGMGDTYDEDFEVTFVRKAWNFNSLTLNNFEFQAYEDEEFEEDESEVCKI